MQISVGGKEEKVSGEMRICLRGVSTQLGILINSVLRPLGLRISRRKSEPRSTLDLARMVLQDRQSAFVVHS